MIGSAAKVNSTQGLKDALLCSGGPEALIKPWGGKRVVITKYYAFTGDKSREWGNGEKEACVLGTSILEKGRSVPCFHIFQISRFF